MAKAKAKPKAKAVPKKAAPKKKRRPTPEKVKRAKNGLLENDNARKWYDEELNELADKIYAVAEEVYSIVEVAVKVGIAYQYLIYLGRTYTAVSKALDLVGSNIAAKAWGQGFKAQGHQNILQMALKRHDKQQVEVEHAQEAATTNMKEATKAKHGGNNNEATVIIQEKVIYKDRPEKPPKRQRKDVGTRKA